MQHIVVVAIIGISMILGSYGMIKLFEKLLLGKEASWRVSLITYINKKGRRADIALLVMLIISSIISFCLAILSTKYIGLSVTEMFNISFLVLAVISFVIYRKYFKGKITLLKYGTHLDTELYKASFDKSAMKRIRYAIFAILIILTVLIVVAMFFFPEYIAKFCNFIDKLSCSK